VRGPFGTAWPLPDGDVVVVAGGIGLAPLLPAVRALDRTERPGRLAVLVGARRPSGLLAGDELVELARRHHVALTVDSAGPTWPGEVGVVTELLRRVPFPLDTATALVCGPEVMMRFAARALEEQGMPAEAVHVSLERNMHCGRGACGHCQLGPFLLCTDGPVVRWSAVDPVLAVRHR
jgi:anaerobic sulfite reductase subunit B